MTLELRPLTGSQDRVLVGACSVETLRGRFFLPGEPSAAAVLATYSRYLLAGPPDGLALAAMLAGQPVGLLNLAAVALLRGRGRGPAGVQYVRRVPLRAGQGRLTAILLAGIASCLR